jgi:predicted NAD/FAD-dependent oxidoreductase
MKIYSRPNNPSAPSFNQIAKYEIENALPNMAPPWPPISVNTESRIFFVGDYTLNGSIEGALQSGLTAARQILGPHQILNPRQTLGERATA